jgi:hypothetical protein
MEGLDRIVTDKAGATEGPSWLDLPVFSPDEAKLRAAELAKLSEREKIVLRHRERWLHRRRATDQLFIR